MLKILACLVMLIDHLGYSVFPGAFWMRIVGRLAFPIFAMYAAVGFQRTRSRPGYLLRLNGWGVLSQLPFALLFFHASLTNPRSLFEETNVLFTFLFALLGLWAIEWARGRGWRLRLASWAAFAACAVAAGLLRTDYGWYGVGVVLLFYLFPDQIPNVAADGEVSVRPFLSARWKRRTALAFSLFFWTLVSLKPMHMHPIQLLCVAALPLMWIPMPDPKPGRWKYAFYAFYPVHILLIWIVCTLFLR